jgi:hypothetical protein
VAQAKRCWAHLPLDRSAFSEIVQELERNPFNDTERKRFENYLDKVRETKRKLDAERSNDDVLLLLKRATQMKVFAEWLNRAVCAAPWCYTVASGGTCLRWPNQFVVDVVNDIFATNHCLNKEICNKLKGSRRSSH